MKNSSDTVGNPTHYLPGCSSVPQPNAPPRGPGSSVGIANDYGLGGPDIESQWGEIFRPSRPALGPTQPPAQCLPVFSWG
jgi:hypothetical protein